MRNEQKCTGKDEKVQKNAKKEKRKKRIKNMICYNMHRNTQKEVHTISTQKALNFAYTQR